MQVGDPALEPAPRPGHHRRDAVAVRAEEVDAARSRLHDARRPGCRRADEQLLQADLLVALEAYAAAVAQAGAPLPYRIRAELNLYRNLTQ